MSYPCFIYLIPWIVAFFLITILVINIKRAMPLYKYYWLHKLLQLFGFFFLTAGILGFLIPSIMGWLNLSLIGAGSLMNIFVEISEMVDGKQDSKDKE